MADQKISQLTGATLPLAGSEVLPIVQSGATKKVATDDLTIKNIRSNATTGILQITGVTASQTRVATVPDANFTVARVDAAQSFTGNQTLATGNLVIGTAGAGIDFSADSSAAGMTSELLNDYEEGTWTPTDASGAGLTLTVTSATYTKVGRMVTAQFDVTYPTTADASSQVMGGLPYTAAAPNYGGFVTYTNFAGGLCLVISGATVIYRRWADGSNNTNAAYSGKVIRGICVYFV
jgi:hypothetical protein